MIPNKEAPISIVMGSQTDYPTMQYAEQILNELDIQYNSLIISAHRTPERLFSFAKEAEENKIKVIIAGAGGAAHLPGMVASMTILPVLGVPIKSKCLNGLDSLLSIAQMPGGVPVGTLAIGESGAKNAAILAASIISLNNKIVAERLRLWRSNQTKSVAEKPDL